MEIKKQVGNKVTRIRDRVTEPEFLLLISGNNELIFEDCRRILEYSQNLISLEGRLKVEITGEDLKLKYLGAKNLSASGKIREIRILQGKTR